MNLPSSDWKESTWTVNGVSGHVGMEVGAQLQFSNIPEGGLEITSLISNNPMHRTFWTGVVCQKNGRDDFVKGATLRTQTGFTIESVTLDGRTTLTCLLESELPAVGDPISNTAGTPCWTASDGGGRTSKPQP